VSNSNSNEQHHRAIKWQQVQSKLTRLRFDMTAHFSSYLRKNLSSPSAAVTNNDSVLALGSKTLLHQYLQIHIPASAGYVWHVQSL